MLTALMTQLNRGPPPPAVLPSPPMRRIPMRTPINASLPAYLASNTEGPLDPKAIHDAYFVAFDAPVITDALSGLLGKPVYADAVPSLTDTSLWREWAPKSLPPRC